ncbi:MAG TPA: DNA polymerase III subunit gamma/tau, partial [Tepidisphaeraceae bacterium]|nr:DNA polymerase III subunit gamma/tau [Tepidisphaeraceae bacterium]
MSYIVLARKYRSRTFDDLIGQEHVAQTLKRAIDSGRIAHAFLFCGTRGTGKTSTARILAKCLNCESSDRPTPQPCGTCTTCTSVARGEDIDVIEIDAASNTGVDNVRDLIANASYRPARSRFKVYIIDEVHMLSKAAFNALLKTMEEPPEHVKFILATTEPEKVLPTILSRCQRYDFRNIPTREIAGHLKSICKEEKIQAEEDALLLVAKAGAGSMRDSLSLLDRLLSVGEKKLTVEMIEQLLGLPKSQLVFDLAQSIGEADVKAVLTRTDKIVTGGLSPDTLLASLVDHLRNLLILRTCGPDTDLVEVPGLSMQDLQGQAARFDPVVLTQDIAILEELRRQLRTSQAGRALLDATLVRLALAEQFNQIGELLTGDGGRSDGAVGGAAGGAALKKKYGEPVTPAAVAGRAVVGIGAPSVAPTAVAATVIVATPAPDPVTAEAPRADEPDPFTTPTLAPPPAVAASPASAISSDDEDDALPAVGKVWDHDGGPSLSELLKQRSSAPVSPPASPAQPPHSPPAAPAPAAHPASNVELVNVDDLPVVWQKLLDALAARGPALHSLVSHGRLSAIEDGRAVISYEKRHETFVKLLDRNGKKDIVRETLSSVAGKPLGVRFEIDAAPPADGAANG